jgi:hypothetical protein
VAMTHETVAFSQAEDDFATSYRVFFSTLVYFAVVLGALIVVHEFGHFIVAKI